MLRPPRFRVLRAFLGGPVFATSLALLLTIAPALAGDVYDAVLLGDVAAVRELIARKADLTSRAISARRCMRRRPRATARSPVC